MVEACRLWVDVMTRHGKQAQYWMEYSVCVCVCVCACSVHVYMRAFVCDKVGLGR